MAIRRRRCLPAGAPVACRGRDPHPRQSGEFLAKYTVSCAKEVEAPVVSGLAYGIDRLVHEWCLRVSHRTISVLGTGILAPYPAKHVPSAKPSLWRVGS